MYTHSHTQVYIIIIYMHTAKNALLYILINIVIASKRLSTESSVAHVFAKTFSRQTSFTRIPLCRPNYENDRCVRSERKCTLKS